MCYHIAFKVQPVKEDDDDHEYNYCILTSSLARTDDDDQWMESQLDLHFNLDQAIAALHDLSEDDLLADMICMDHPTGCYIWKEATSPTGVALDSLAYFATHELRLQTIELFMRENFSHSVLCDRTNSMAQYKVRDTNVNADHINELIEKHLLDLMLVDYEVTFAGD